VPREALSHTLDDEASPLPRAEVADWDDAADLSD
jgi:hypothetical protein